MEGRFGGVQLPESLFGDTGRAARESRYEFLDRLSQLTAGAADADEILALTTRLTAQYLEISNCAYADMDEDQDGFTIRGNWHAPGSPSIVGHYSLADFGVLAVQELRAGRPLVINDNRAEIAPDEARTFQEIGIAATICMPLVKGGRLIALMAIHDRSPHQWSEAELELIRHVTQRSWAHVERVRADAELRASNLRFQAAIKATNGVLWTNDAEGRMVGEQPGWAALTGQTFEQYQGYGWSDALHPEDVVPSVAAWKEAVSRRAMFVFEHRVTCADGQTRRFAIRAVPVMDVCGTVTEWVGVHTDITEEYAAETALREESRILETLNRTGAALAGELDLSVVVQAATDAGVELTSAQFGAFFYNVINAEGESYMLFSLSGAEPWQFDFGMPRATPVFHPTFAGEGTVRSDDITSDPRYGKWAPHFGMPDGHLPVVSYLAVPVISRSKEVLGGLFFGHPEPAQFNERHERLMMGIAAQAAIAIDNARLYQAVQKANETLEQRVEERTLALRTANEALAQSQRLQALGKLTGGIAHDFNNLMTVIGGSAEMLQRRADLAPAKREMYLKGIVDTVHRATQLTDQLLAFGRQQAIKPQVLALDDNLRAFAEVLARTLGSRIEVALELNAGDARVNVDPAQLEAAVLNAAVNARDAMPNGGRIDINSAPVVESGAQMLRVSVIDNGLGMPERVREHAFEPFFTTKDVGQGTGLGLSQIHGFAAQAGGRAAIESEEGQGTSIHIFLPVADAPLTRAAVAGQTGTLPAGLRVMLVEDNEMVRAFAAELLQDLGCQVTSAESGEQALALLESALPELVLSDVVMPGISGIELARQIRVSHPHLPILLATGYSEEIVGTGSEFYVLAKPYSSQALVAAMSEVLVPR